MKINIVGTSGSGKSTLSRRLAQRLNVPCIEMDRLYWRADWQGTPDNELYARLEQALAASPGWVLDGNYNRSRPVKWRNVDLVVWLDYGFGRTLRQRRSGRGPATGRAFAAPSSAASRLSGGR